MTSNFYFDRKWSITVNNGEEIKIFASPLDGADNVLNISFSIVKTADLKSNDAEINIVNLSPASRDFMFKGCNVEVSAGYKGQIGLIYKGIIEFVSHIKEGTEWNTRLVLKDAALHWRELGVSVTFDKDTPVEKMIAKLLDVLTLPPDIDAKLKEMSKLSKAEIKNLPTVLYPKAEPQTRKRTKRGPRLSDAEWEKKQRAKEAEAAKKKAIREQQSDVIKLKKAEMIKGSAMKALDFICKSFNLKPIIEDQAISIFPLGVSRASAGEDIVFLTPSSGLIGSPEPIEKGGYRFVTLLRSDLKLFSDVIVNSDEIQGTYRISRIEYSGERRGQNWYATIEGDPV